MKAKSILLIAAAAMLFISAGCIIQQEQAPEAAANGEKSRAELTIKYTDANGEIIAEETISTPKGVNAWILMRENMEVEFDSYDFGPFVKSIAGVAAPEGYYLALYVNGQYADRGINGYFINQDMEIEWKTEKIGAFG